MKRYTLAVSICLLAGLVTGQTSQFDILKGGDKIGTIAVSRTGSIERSIYRMTSLSEFQLIWTKIIYTNVHAEYSGGRLTRCHSSVRVNDSLKDSSNMVLSKGSALCFVHPDSYSRTPIPDDWTTARMYFEEPVGTERIFVESVLQHCAITNNGNGSYTLTFPDASQNHYIYEKGRLMEIHVDRTLFDLVFRRV